MANRCIVPKPAVAAKGPAMAAPNQKALQANNKNRKALGDIGNLVGARNAKCNINKDAPMERSRTNFVVNANKGANPSTQQSQPHDIVVKAGAKAEPKVIRGNSQRRIIRRKAQNDTVTQKDTVVSVGHSIDSSAQGGGLQAPSQLKATKPITQSQTTVLTARSEDVQEVLPSIDDGDLENQLEVVEYVEDIYKFYRKIENTSCVPPDYMKRQNEINETMRAILISWLIQVHLKCELMPETLYLTVYIMDRYLSIHIVRKWELQLVGITAMLMACKYQDTRAPQVNELIRISGYQYTSKMIVAMEHTILNRLNFNLSVPTPYVFLVMFLKAAGADKVVK